MQELNSFVSIQNYHVPGTSQKCEILFTSSLGIEQAAAFIRETKRSINDLLPLYLANRSTPQKLHKWVQDGNRAYQYPVATRQMSFTLTNTDLECPAAALLLQLFAFLNPDMILPDFLEAGQRPSTVT
jgi:hypothetical protein